MEMRSVIKLLKRITALFQDDQKCFENVLTWASGRGVESVHLKNDKTGILTLLDNTLNHTAAYWMIDGKLKCFILKIRYRFLSLNPHAT